MSVSQGSCSLPSNDKPTVMVTNCPAIAFTLRVSTKARLLNKRYTEHLQRNEHKNIEDLREDISCGIQLQQKWSRQQKYLLASVREESACERTRSREQSSSWRIER